MDKRIVVSTLFSLALLVGCGDDSGANGPGSSAAWTATLNGVAAQFAITSQTAVIQSDGGLLVTLEGSTDGEAATFTLDIAGGTEISPTEETPVELSAGSISLNGRFETAEIPYRATTGNYTFSAYGVEIGDTVTGTAEIGLVAFGENEGNSASLAGSFSATVVAASD